MPGLRSGRVKPWQLQTRTASDRSAAQRGVVASPGVSFLPPCHPSRHHPACDKVPDYLGTYLALSTGAAASLHNTYMPSQTYCVLSHQVYELGQTPQKSERIRGHGAMASPYCVRDMMIAGESGRPSRCHCSGFKLRSCLVLPVQVPVPVPRPWCPVHCLLPRPSPPCHATLTAPSVLLSIQSRWTFCRTTGPVGRTPRF